MNTLTKTEKKTTRRTIERNYTLYLYTKAKIVLAKVVTKDTDVKKGKPVTAWYLFSRTIYEKYQHRNSWTWIIHLGTDDLFTVMGVKYMNHYLNSCHGQYPDDEPRYVAESGWKKVLDNGDYGRIAQDKMWWDGMLYDPQGNPIRRAFRCDYINTGVCSESYEIAKVEKWLKRQKSVKDLKIISVPHYNQETCGQRAIEFIFQPSPKVFLLMCKEGALDSFKLSEFIKKHLGITKFQINQTQ